MSEHVPDAGNMVERVARALFDYGYNPAHLSLDEAWKRNMDNVQDWYRGSARAAIAAMREPTEAMCDAAYETWTHGDNGGHERACFGEEWDAAIDEALK